MMEIINILIDGYNIPLLSAFLLGVLTAVSPCPLATNITAVAYIARDMRGPRRALCAGLAYTLGRAIAYTLVAALMYVGFSSFSLHGALGGWGERALGPLLIVLGLVMLGAIRLPSLPFSGAGKLDALKERLARQGYAGSLALGMLFALAFCPYSGVLFFGAFVPLMLGSGAGLLLAPVFALGTGLPVIVFSALIAYGMRTVGTAFNAVQSVERYARTGVAVTFLVIGVYYLQYLFGT